MKFDLQEALAWYKKQGAPQDQPSVVSLLKEIQQEFGGIPRWTVTEAAEYLGVKESYFLALIRRMPSLRMLDSHCLEICAGPNCPKKANLAGFAEKLPKKPGLTVKLVPCMRLCGKGPNIRFDGKIYHGADEALIQKLVEEKA